MHLFRKVSLVASLCLPSVYLSAAVTDAQLSRLGTDLTPMGAEVAGNKAGTIPQWTGGITQPPKSYAEGMFHPDPFADDKPLFTIDKSNYEQYKDGLTAGHIVMLEQKEGYKLVVYPTRRSASLPQKIYDATKKYAASATLSADGENVTGIAAGAIPFPFPTTGKQVVWNHRLRYQAEAVKRFPHTAVPTASGNFQLLKSLEEVLFTYPLSTSPETMDKLFNYYYVELLAPPKVSGKAVMIHVSIDQVNHKSQAWGYNPSNRKVKRAPDFGYDNPSPVAGGMRVNDQNFIFNGAMDRYDWEVIGKKEMFVPYNSYQLHSGDITPEEIIRAGSINQDLARYELHRVWVVEATLKAGARHLYPRRTLYIDEDSWMAVVSDLYNDKGTIHRVSEGHTINYYEIPMIALTNQVHYDLPSGRYVIQGLDNQDAPYDHTFVGKPSNYTPSKLRRRAK